MKLFNKPKWLKPEINELVYWVHLGVLLGVVYLLMNWHNPEKNFLIWMIYLGLGDITAHTVLGLD